ncbi:thiamine-monophosphate kinase [Thermaurantimonas aggregans]|uniref:Thiamine-monophosphate kinase n=1 Tax=Thermaurantimonas aggregans TaxID=2173829 RepID=A0A401XIN4_9FLAO|nr:thiamine-phosphate kinase [Thermaurantimonas aggregans]MCX8148796.1 thiamine-phosphate kinase [Thermaurantimonas aggregans]GCD76853.1 thiamine-monophosphate kinase [Thermaurantimonas aggregans]
MLEDKNKKFTPLSELGEFGLIDHLSKLLTFKREDTIIGIGDDAAILDHNGYETLISKDLLTEGVHFDFFYTPLKHLGYKAIVVNISDIAAMGGEPTHAIVGIAVSARSSVEALEEIYEGMQIACSRYGIELVGGDTTTSTSGMTISVTAIGRVKKGEAILRSTAKPSDLIVVTGDLGGAYCGLLVLEREKEVFKANPYVQPDLSPYDYVVRRLLRPEARTDALEQLKALGIRPTSMIDISDGLSSELLHITTKSGVGARIYENKLPIDQQTFKVCEEMQLNATTVALNGGEDYELLFTIPLSDYEKIKNHPDFTVIGHMTEPNLPATLVTNLNEEIPITAQGWNSFKKQNT